jgi:ABC-type molybdate transport system substrate-binding protein
MVADANGSVLEGATVQLSDMATLKTSTKTSTDERGGFSFADVAPGIYRVIATRGGYQIAGDGLALTAEYGFTVPANAANASGAARFGSFLLSLAAQDIFREFGFLGIAE